MEGLARQRTPERYPEQAPEKRAEREPNQRASIRMEIFRHDAKDKPTTAGSRVGDEFARLTPEGRKAATAKGKAKNPEPRVALAIGSPRQRSQEQALRTMLADVPEITDDMTLEDVMAFIKKEQKVGKLMVTEDLNFNWDGSKEFHDIGYQHMLESKDALKFLAEESDRLVEKVFDAVSTSYSRTAGNVAEVVMRYVKMLPQWQIIANKYPEKYNKYKQEMQRFVGTHQTVSECFLLKVIEKVAGKKERDEVISEMPNGFGLSEGFSLVIDYKRGAPIIIVSYKNHSWTADERVVQEIITDRDELNKRIGKAVAAKKSKPE